MVAKSEIYYGTGKRKTAIARVYLTPGKGSIQVNNQSLDQYFCRDVSRMVVKQPLVLLNVQDKYDLKIFVRGSGDSSQAGAIRLGVARALVACEVNKKLPLDDSVLEVLKQKLKKMVNPDAEVAAAPATEAEEKAAENPEESNTHAASSATAEMPASDLAEALAASQALLHDADPADETPAPNQLMLAAEAAKENPAHYLLRKAGFLTRDARKVERKKVGHHKARKSTQFSKR